MYGDLREYLDSRKMFSDPDWFFPEDGDLVTLEMRLNDLDREMEEVEFLWIGLEDLKGTIESLDNPTTRELALVKKYGDTLLSTLGISTETLIPGLEDIGNGNVVSLEEVDGVLVRFAKTILSWMQSVWEYVGSFFNRIADNVNRLRDHNQKMRDRMVEASKGKMVEGSIELPREVNNLAIDGKPPSNGNDIIQGLKRLQEQSDVVFKDYMVSLVGVGSALADAIGQYDENKPEQSLERVYNAASDLDLKRLIDLTKGKTVQDARWKNGSASTSEPLPGNKSIIFYYPRVAGKDALLAKSETRRRKAVLFEDTRAKQNKLSGNLKMKTIQVAESYEINRLVNDLLSTLDFYKTKRKELDKVHKRVISAIRNMEKRQKAIDSNSQSDRVFYQEVMKYGQTFSFWVKNPQVPLASQISRTCRAAIIACNHSSEAYRK